MTLAKIEPMLLVNFLAEICGEKVQRCTLSQATDPVWGSMRNIVSLTLLTPGHGEASEAWQAASVSQVFVSGTSDHIKYVTCAGKGYVVPSRSDLDVAEGDWAPNYERGDVYVVPSETQPCCQDADWLKVYGV
ncbi:hypothetical protein PHO31112_02337 [Pandoraea horticolens]|uniref:Uncharacterized protein n=1 Tax=Pandoraea horticolens TaxID=2508298 RepID=A0A5E4V0X6_9BURK|nr:hypothetical protein PHO31112_02337 [Pandoraea horticolens]